MSAASREGASAPSQQDDERYATFCLECGAMYFEGEEGFDYEECIECEGDTTEVPA